MPAASRRSNMGMPNISQYVLRGCGSSVYSIDTAQPCLRQYSICAVICSSVRSGRKEKVPCVSRIAISSSSFRGRWHEVGCVGAGVVKCDVAPGVERGLQRGTCASRFREDVGPLVPDVATLIACQHHRLEGHTVGRCAGGNTVGMSDRAAAELQHAVLTEIGKQLVHLPCVNA